MSSIKERILNFIKEEGHSKSEFYRKTGITRGVLDKDSGLTEVNIAKFIAAYPEVKLDWLIKGYGQVRDAKFQDPEIVSEPNDRYIVSNKLIPMYSQEGFREFVKDKSDISQSNVLGKYLIPDFEQADCMLRIQGNDMNPLYSSGDIVSCKTINSEGFVQWGRVHVLLTKTYGLIFRRVQPSAKAECYTLSTGNESYPDFDINISEIEAIAVVLGVVRMQ